MPTQLTHESEEETMVKVILSRSMSLDSFVAGPDDAMEWMFDWPGPIALVEEGRLSASPGCRQLDTGLTACRWHPIAPDIGGHR
jgi:hypothetical protein